MNLGFLFKVLLAVFLGVLALVSGYTFVYESVKADLGCPDGYQRLSDDSEICAYETSTGIDLDRTRDYGDLSVKGVSAFISWWFCGGAFLIVVHKIYD